MFRQDCNLYSCSDRLEQVNLYSCSDRKDCNFYSCSDCNVYFVFQMPFFTKSEIEERKNKILTITRNIADLQSTQNTIKESIEGLLKEDARLQAEQNELIEEVMRLSADIADGEAKQRERYGPKSTAT